MYLIISKLEQGGSGIRSWRQHEDQRPAAVGVSKCFAKVKRRWLNKPLAKFSGDKVLDCGRHLKWNKPLCILVLIFYSITLHKRPTASSARLGVDKLWTRLLSDYVKQVNWEREIRQKKKFSRSYLSGHSRKRTTLLTAALTNEAVSECVVRMLISLMTNYNELLLCLACIAYNRPCPVEDSAGSPFFENGQVSHPTLLVKAQSAAPVYNNNDKNNTPGHDGANSTE